MEAHKIVRRRGSHIFYTIGSQIAGSLSALRAGRSLLAGKFTELEMLRSKVCHLNNIDTTKIAVLIEMGRKNINTVKGWY
jgi:hypothetical protein